MTTIAWDGSHLCSDSRVSTHKIEGDTFKKIRKIKGMLVGGCGEYSEILHFFQLLRHKDITLESAIQLSNFDDGSLRVILVKNNNKGFFVDNDKGVLVPISPPYAIGSGGDFAKGAMDFGATAKEAVQIAKRNDPLTGGRIYTLTLDGYF